MPTYASREAGPTVTNNRDPGTVPIKTGMQEVQQQHNVNIRSTYSRRPTDTITSAET
jgi:hypothetical protein